MNRRYFSFILPLIFISSTFAQGINKVDRINMFIPEGFKILDSASGNLNKDTYLDLVPVLQTKSRATEDDGVRPLILLTHLTHD